MQGYDGRSRLFIMEENGYSGQWKKSSQRTGLLREIVTTRDITEKEVILIDY